MRIAERRGRKRLRGWGGEGGGLFQSEITSNIFSFTLQGTSATIMKLPVYHYQRREHVKRIQGGCC